MTSLWQSAASGFLPSTIIDVGANYGEIVFSALYVPKANIIAIEANRVLLPYLLKSASKHPNRKQMKIICALASDAEESDKTFYINRLSTGRSSAIPLSPRNMLETTVPSMRIDSLFHGMELSKERLLFKIDVEGYEYFVIRGMDNLLQGCESCIGIIECDSKYIRKSGIGLDEFLTFLQSAFNVFLPISAQQLLAFDPLTSSSLQQHFNSEIFHTDLLLVSPNLNIERLGFNVSLQTY
ncbi:FkbM family methyltransferase [Cohnella cholangitidis]|uniref:FkbM family methyltransferase n=1 Tax=Cohnella cholangitidis TaxID=2598458 RepID=UPI001E5EC199|nr:FkbM family methyltransferase [Cohnella cholangitidis]